VTVRSRVHRRQDESQVPTELSTGRFDSAGPAPMLWPHSPLPTTRRLAGDDSMLLRER